jgi:predicted outer membrane repeat protein
MATHSVLRSLHGRSAAFTSQFLIAHHRSTLTQIIAAHIIASLRVDPLMPVCTLFIAGFAAFILSIALPTPAYAETIVVTSTLDSGVGTLRTAMQQAAPGDTIAFDSSVFSTPLTITLVSGQMEISKSLTLDGTAGGAITPTLSGNDASRLFLLHSGVSVTLRGVRLANGSTPSHGAAIYNQGVLRVEHSAFISNTTSYGKGGAVYNDTGATLTLVDCVLADNHAAFGYGGGVFNLATTSIVSSTFTGNSSFNAGGAIDNEHTLIISSSTFFRNSATTGGAVANNGIESTVQIVNATFVSNTTTSHGGAINSWGLLTVTNSTFFGNGSAQAEALYTFGPTLLRNTIVAGSSGGHNCQISQLTSDHNLEDADTCGFGTYTTTYSLVNTNPLLGQLQVNPPGQPIATLALLPGSPAINAGNDAFCPATDERGVRRPIGTHCDIGAYEAMQQVFVPIVQR